MPKILYEEVIEVEERVIPFKDEIVQDKTNRIEVLPNNQKIEVLKELDLEKLERDLNYIKNSKGITNIAVILMHSYLYNHHEIQIGRLAKKLDFKNISLSHEISPMIRFHFNIILRSNLFKK